MRLLAWGLLPSRRAFGAPQGRLCLAFAQLLATAEYTKPMKIDFVYSLTGIFLLGYISSMNTETLAALAEPNRLKIVELLKENPRRVGEIATRLRMRQPQSSKHLRVLLEAGIVDMRPAAQQRVYYLQAKPFKELDSWLDTFRPTWEARLDVMEEFLRDIQGKKKKP